MEVELFPRISFPAFLLHHHLRGLAQSRPQWVDCPVGIAWHDRNKLELLVARHRRPGGHFLRLWLEDRFRRPDFGNLARECIATLQLGLRADLGRASGWAKAGATWTRLVQLQLVGPGMHSITLVRGAGDAFDREHTHDTIDTEGRWSRTLGALGPANHRRLTNLSVGLIGCGRSGSVLANNLARLGVKHLVLADPDVVELHNVGEGEFAPSDAGQHKVLALQNRILRECPEARIHVVRQTATHLQAIETLQSCDVLFSAPDQPAARLTAGALAAAYARPLIDVGTRVHRGGMNTMGADIRLIGPERCLLCFGGVNQEELGRQLLESPDAEEEFQMLRDWREERPGSLRSLNELSVSIAQRFLEDYVLARITESVWCHIEFGPEGRMAVTYPTPPQQSIQPCACEILGWGDAGLSRFAGILRRRQEQARTSAASSI